MHIALIDSDIIVYRSSILTEEVSEDDAIDLCERMHVVWMDAARCDAAVRCLTTGKSFRSDAWPDYKANRADKPKPRHLDAVRNHVANSGAMMHPKWEADDVLGFLHTSAELHGEHDTVLVTVDKDLDQVPGWHCNPDKELLYEVSPDDAELYRWMQVLSGDTTDNYAGIPFVGQKKALKFLTDVPVCEMRSVVESIYVDKGLDLQYLEAMIVCSSIIQYSEETKCELLSLDSTVESTLLTFLRSLPRFVGCEAQAGT